MVFVGCSTAPTSSSPISQPSVPAEPTAAKTVDAPVVEGPIAVGAHGAVSSAEAHASRVGIEILQAGGNAIDAAVAVGFALAVTHPSAGNIGGGGFMVIRLDDGQTAAIDYRETAPAAAFRDMYIGEDGEPTPERLVGPKAAGIPGSVSGLALAHQKFGTLPWAKLVAPAVSLAEDGWTIDTFHADDLNHGVKRMREAGYEASAKLYSKADGSMYEAGDTWVQPLLAATLKSIETDGPRAFYEGPLAETMVAEVRAAGGIWTTDDLASYQAKARDPIVFDYHDHRIITMPPPSAGGVVLRQLLAAADVLDLASLPWRSPEEVHLYVEAARRTYADRNYLLADPDFVDVPMEALVDTRYVKNRLASIDPDHATPSSEIRAGTVGKQESHQTTHYSVVDGDGNAVSVTTTLNLGFGARFVAGETGVLLNNEMDDFAVKPGTANVFGLVQGEANRIEPGKRMLSSMTPTIIERGGKLRAVVGSPGGPTITTTVLQITRALIDYNLPLEAAVESVRVHHQWLPDMIWTEERITPELEAELRAKGHEIRKRPGMGHANCIEIDAKTGERRAVADVSRDGGQAAAY